MIDGKIKPGSPEAMKMLLTALDMLVSDDDGFVLITFPGPNAKDKTLALMSNMTEGGSEMLAKILRESADKLEKTKDMVPTRMSKSDLSPFLKSDSKPNPKPAPKSDSTVHEGNMGDYMSTLNMTEN